MVNTPSVPLIVYQSKPMFLPVYHIYFLASITKFQYYHINKILTYLEYLEFDLTYLRKVGKIFGTTEIGNVVKLNGTEGVVYIIIHLKLLLNNAQVL